MMGVGPSTKGGFGFKSLMLEVGIGSVPIKE
jgi:hypothetical protein